jgi:L-threonylcarbamoyladenylate synthase
MAEVLKINPLNPEEDLIGRAARVLKSGGVIGYPTETVYGIGCNIFHPAAVSRIYKIKKRPLDKAFILIAADPLQVRAIVAEIPENAERLMESFWPGPLTIVFRASPSLAQTEFRRVKTIAVRIPDSAICLSLLKHCGFPLVSTSANASGGPAASNTRDVIALFQNELDLIIDGGSTPGAVPSTIVDVTKNPVKIVREGAITKLEINTVLETV